MQYKDVPKYEVHKTEDKIYIADRNSGKCVARLCSVSAEFWMGDTVDSIDKCTLSKFKEECLKRFNIKGISSNEKKEVTHSIS